MFHYTYITRAVDGRYYIGVRPCACLPAEDTYMGSHTDTSYFPTRKKILSVFESRKAAMDHEIYLHELRDVGISHRYANRARQISTGFSTFGVTPSPETKEKLSKALKGKIRSEEHRKKLGKARKGKKLGPLSEEHRRKISEAGKGKTRSEETRRRIKEVRTGTKRSEKTREKLREVHRGKKWFYDPESKRATLCFPENRPSGYLPGRKPKP
jgi:hypothetical protein